MSQECESRQLQSVTDKNGSCGHFKKWFLLENISNRATNKKTNVKHTGTQGWNVRTPTLTATSSFSNVPLKQIWSKLSIILSGTTYKSTTEWHDWNIVKQDSRCASQYLAQHQFISLYDTQTSHPGYFSDGALCDLLVDVEACSTLEEGDGFPQVSIRHLHQSCYTLNRNRNSHHTLTSTAVQRK